MDDYQKFEREQLKKASKAIKKAKPKKKTKSNKDDNVIYTSYIETDRYILEEIANATHTTLATHATDIKFLKYNKKTGSTEKIDVFFDENKVDVEYRPIVDKLIEKGAILLPSDIEEYESDKKLVEDISNFLYKYFEVPKSFERFLPYLVLFYWVYEKFPFVPYLHFVGLTGTGKTTAQEIFGSICYKPIDASGSITMSPIFRTSNTWKGTLLLDEFEANGDGYREMLAFLKSGVGNKAVLRTEGEKRREVMAYMIKSPKIFTSEQPINNAGLQSRTIVIQMQKSKKRLPLMRLPKFYEEAQAIRNKLLLWRFRNLNNINLNDIEYGFEELECFDRRVQQVITPIYYLSDKDTRKEIVNFAKKQEEETKKERLESLEGQIFQTIVDILPEYVTLKAITEKINENRSKRRPITARKIGSVVRKIFKFEIERMGNQNISTLILDNQEEKIKELCDYFGISPEHVASVANVADNSLEHTDNENSATHLSENATDATH